MREVAIIGIGQVKIDEHWTKSLRDLAGEALYSAMVDADRDKVDGLFIGNMLSGSLGQQENLGALIADWAGLDGIETVKVETACSSGGSALRAGIIAVASGELENVLVLGVEKMTDAKTTDISAALVTAADADFESAQGLTFVGINALVMRRYMHEFGWQHSDFAPFSLTAHHNAVTNPYARLPFEISTEEYRRARMVADPINLLDASPIGDGAAAVLLVPLEKVNKNNKAGSRTRAIAVTASAVATDTMALHDRRQITWLSAAHLSAKRAYSQAGKGPKDIDFFELHDAFSIMAVLSLEACGFADHGCAPRLGLEEKISKNGTIPISTFGGLKARGHPVGATGIYQIVEIVQQLRYEAGKNQIDPARVGMAQNIGGSGATIVTHILQSV